METPRQQGQGQDPPTIYGEDDNDDTAKAFKAIQAQLDQWTSPRMATASSRSPWTDVSAMAMDDDDDDGMVLTGGSKTSKQSTGSSSGPTTSASAQQQTTSSSYYYPYDRNVMDWWNRELVDPLTNNNNDGTTAEDDEFTPLNRTTKKILRTTNKNRSTTMMTTPLKQQKRGGGPNVERAATPIMSNSSRKKQQQQAKGMSNYNTTSGTLLSSIGQEEDIDEIQVDNDDEPMSVNDEDDDDDMMPVNVQSPWVPPLDAKAPKPLFTHQQHQYYTSSTTPRAISPYRNQQYEYRRYHDSLRQFLKAKRNLSDRIGMDREERALSLMAQEEKQQQQEEENMSQDFDTLTSSVAATTTTTADPKLAHEETMVDLEFLRTLKSLCWERDPIGSGTTPTSTSSSGQQQQQQKEDRDWMSRREGNCWALIQELRSLGFAALLWANDDASERQNRQAQSAFCETKAAEIHATPKELVDSMTGYDAPLVLKRRKHILKWLEHCLDQLVPAETKASVSSSSSSVGAILTNIGSSSRHLEKALVSCLALVLAGRVKDARVILRKAGQPWMAAKLSGGAPVGIQKVANEDIGTVEQVKVGNVNRPLWKRQMWKLSQKLSSNNNTSSSNKKPSSLEEAAIHSILASDYRNAMENPALRSWEKGLYVLFHATWSRSEDELLHLHNNHRRSARPPFPGTQYLEHEREQLQATSPLSNLSEWGVLEMLSVSPFAEMKGNAPLCGAIASVLVGQTALTDYLEQETNALTIHNNNSMMDDEEPNHSISRLRFVTHLLLYLDSLSACTTPVTLEGVNECKNQALFAYVEHLASHEDLWHFLVLYASMLPEHVLLDYFPSVLVRVEGEEERRMMIRQSRELFPGDGLDLTILRTVIRLMLSVSDTLEEQDTDTTNTPTRSDIRKMKAIQWLCFYDEHLGDALIAANMLFRQFLLANKFASANMFLQDFLPSEVFEKIMTGPIVAPNQLDQEDAIAENEFYQTRVGQARAEHAAFQSYLKAIRAMNEWSLVISSTPVSDAVVDDKLDLSAFNEKEQGIAKSMERRELISQKRKTSQVVVDAAETVRKDIMNVLLQDGGWLADNDENMGFSDNSEEGLQRKQEIYALRSRLLPHAVKLLHQVCEDTAAWMWQSLLVGSPALGTTPKEVLEALDDGTMGAKSPLSPKFWTQQALSLAETVSSDEYAILEAFEAADLKEVLTKSSDIALADLMYSA